MSTTEQGQAVCLPEVYPLGAEDHISIYGHGRRIVPKPKRRNWSRKCLSFVGSVPGFPDPEAPPRSITELCHRLSGHRKRERPEVAT